jgi:ATP-binding cassette subfamily B multidrug efflux pump
MLDRNTQLMSTETSKAQSVGKTLRRLWRYFRLYALALILVALAVVGGTYMQVMIPNLTGQAVDCYLGPYAAREFGGGTSGQLPSGLSAENLPVQETPVQEDAFGNCWFTDPQPLASAEETIQGLGQLVLLIIVLFVGSSLLSGLQFYLMSWAGFRVLRDLRADIFQHIHALSMGFFNKQEAGDVMSRVTNDIDTLQQVIGFGLVSVLQGSLLIIWIVVVMFRMDFVFALISLVTLPLMFIATRWFSGQARKAFRRARVEIGTVNADLQENIAAVREVQAFSREDENIEQFRVSNAANRDANIQAQAYSSALAPTLEALSYVSLAIVGVVGGLALLYGQGILGATVSLGLIVTFIGYTQQFNRPVQQISVLWTNIQSAIAGAERIFDLLDVDPDIKEKPDAFDLPEIEGSICFQDVWSEYNPGEPVLRGINIETRPGETVAIVGPTGAGKTTIIKLLPRFWDVQSGSVQIDGYDVRGVTKQSLRKQIGIVLQDTFLFSDSVMNNIRYGRPEATDEEVVEAAKLARADSFIQKLENGYDTVLGERGSGLSQGQRQLLAIARVALINPRILILDEATSSVDTRTERLIQRALDEMLAGRTSFVIAHRLSTIRNADQVLVLDQGQIIERGTHEELLAAKGFYYDLYTSQFRREIDEDSGMIDEISKDAYFVPGD